mmetsp:Transcript_1534/g.3396  ORF Transcript_1534/g.3396 Transcript_1534/m.3396 type:complete len:696 (+) Transcript_1534:188-2275(+)
MKSPSVHHHQHNTNTIDAPAAYRYSPTPTNDIINKNSSSGGRKSTPESRSSILSRARQYTRRIEQQEQEEDEERRRSTSSSPPTTNTSGGGSSQKENNNDFVDYHYDQQQRQVVGVGSATSSPNDSKSFREVQAHQTQQATATATPRYSVAASSTASRQTSQQQRKQMATPSPNRSSSRRSSTTTGEDQHQQQEQYHHEEEGAVQQQQQQQLPKPEQQQQPVVSPELLVDALSGHEDGLLAIAERMMEHYDSGYDAMGEAIIDAFADVQKLFQHVVEAAHMEGAAFEASRREDEIKELRERAAAAERDGLLTTGDDGIVAGNNDEDGPTSPSGGPVRHDEFIDQDVKDCLNDAIKQAAAFKDTNRHVECYELYEQACQSASALLPVDSDHRGRLQLSIARAESMSPDRGCAILRYAMDDVLRSGLRPGKIQPTIDPSKRADVVLSKPKGHPSQGSASHSAGVVQSNEEALNSLVAEMKEILEAPVYKDTPLQDVAKRFWSALQENQKLKSKTEERLEHNLGKLKGDYLLARAEWEEKLNNAQEQADLYKRKYQTAKDGKETSLMEDARSMMSQVKLSSMSGHDSMDLDSSGYPSLGGNSSFRVPGGRPEESLKRGVESVASMGSNLAHHAKSLVGQFACTSNNDRTGQVINSDHATEAWRDRRNAAAAAAQASGSGSVARATGSHVSPGPRHVDV